MEQAQQLKSTTLEKKKARPNYIVLQETHFKYRDTDSLKVKEGRGTQSIQILSMMNLM